jgi:hypothetical protein
VIGGHAHDPSSAFIISKLACGLGLAIGPRMKPLVLTAPVVLLALLLSPSAARAQPVDPPEGATIVSAQVSGFDLRDLSPGLQDEIARLAGGPLNRARLDELASRIEEEQPRFVAAVRVVRVPDEEVRVVFVVAHMRDQDRGDINARYLIERVRVEGIPESDVSEELRAEFRRLEGTPLGSDDVDQVETKLRESLPGREIRRRVVRGSRSGEVLVLFRVRDVERPRWLRFEPLQSNLVYHSEQGWGAFLDFPISSRDFRFTPIFAIDNGDDLIEEYSGFGLRFEARRLGTQRLGASLEWSTFDPEWRDTTLAAAGAGAAYEQRSTITPLVSFAVTPTFRVSGGVSITELDPFTAGPTSQMANAAVFSVGYDDRWDRGPVEHDVAAAFTVRAASATLESDFDYTRYLGQAEYRYERRRHTVVATGLAGGIGGTAPLFERFSLGDSRTLRGWDKYDIAPAGGNRVWHASLEYRYSGFGFFLDTGSVWDVGADARVRVAAGGGYHAGPFFMTVGFPLNTDDVRAVFTTGVRFGGVGFRKY